MRSNNYKSVLAKSGLATALLVVSGAVFGQQQVNLTAAASTAALPDGTAVPMWGYSCGTAVSNSTATCAKTNPAASGWSPVIITVPTGQDLTINLTNSLVFGANSVPTSLVIVGQLGGGLGAVGAGCTGGTTCTASPDHTNAQPVTWPIAGDAPGQVPLTGVGTPPAQGTRAQSFATEVAPGATTSLTWTAPRPGTYLIESGTHPSIQGPMGLYGVLVVTAAPGAGAGTAYGTPGTAQAVTYNADVPLVFSEIDPVQNAAVAKAVTLSGFSETTVWSGLPGGCGNPATPNSGNCYPPAVNYIPLYYLINGVAFDKTNSSRSLFPASVGSATAPVTGTVLVRLVNAGLRMHVPSIVGSLTGAAASGFSLIAEDGNPLPGLPRVQSEVFMAAGKTYDVMINAPVTAAGGTAPPALPVFDRELSLSGNSTARDAGMLAYIGINGAAIPGAAALAAAAGAAAAVADNYPSVVAGTPLIVSSPSRGVIGNDINISTVKVSSPPTNGSLTLAADGTFRYVPNTPWTSDSFRYCGNGTTDGAGVATCAAVTLGACSTAACLGTSAGIVLMADSYTASNGPRLSVSPIVPAHLAVNPPGVLANDSDAAGFPLSVDLTTPPALTGPCNGTVSVNADGSFTATATAAGTCTFSYFAKNSQGTRSASSATVSVTFPAGNGPVVTVKDGQDKQTLISDYRWVIEEDRTFYVDPKCTTNPPPAGCPTAASGLVPTFGTNFHTSYMPVIATGCTGTQSCESGQTVVNAAGAHVPAVCDIGDGVCRPGPDGVQQAPLDPSQVALDPSKRYYISILPGDAGNDFANGNLTADCAKGVASATNPTACGHGMGGAPIAALCTPLPPATTCTAATARPPVTIYSQPAPYPTAKLSIFVFQDDFPLNGEQDGGGGIDVLSPNEGGLGGFNITLFDDAGGTGDATGQMTYDMFNQPLVNSLAGTIDPVSGKDACPISAISRIGTDDKTQLGITGTIVTCPKYEADGVTLSPLAGQAVIANLMPGRYGVVATPGADRIGRGEEWLQTNTLDGQKAHDSFLRVGEPSFFQEFGPAGYHVTIGFANPAIINGRKRGVCDKTDPFITGSNCTNTLTGKVTTERMSRTPDERLYSSGSNDSFAFTQCYVSFGDPDGEDFAFTKCNPDGTFTLSGLPDGDWRVTVFDQWNDMLVDGLSTPVRLAGGATVNLGDIATNQWQANIYTKSFIDLDGDGVMQSNEPGLTLVPTNIRFRDGSYSNFNNTDLAGNAGFNEEFPLFSWYVIESDTTRFKNTGTHVVYDAGGPADGSPACGGGNAPCGGSSIGNLLANTAEQIPVPPSLRIPGAVYCDTADCTGLSVAKGPVTGGSSGPGGSTGRIDPPWVQTEGWQGFSGQNSFLEFGKKPFAAGENGGIHGEVIYASTRPFDDPALLIHTSWTPDVPGVKINLYKVGAAADGVTQTLTLVDTTTTSSWDDWAQGFRADGVPYMNCPGQGTDSGTAADLFYFTLFNQPMYLDVYKNGVAAARALPNNSQFKCYDGMHNWNQLQPAPYDGMYSFPSVTSIDPKTGKPAGTNCTACISNPDATDPFRHNTPMLPAGQYVVEMIVPPGYELVKEEDKNILIGDNYIAPVTQEFPGLGSAIYILPDQAEVAAAYNANNAQNSTVAFGRTTLPSHEGDTGSVETFWPCVGAARVVPDYISLFPQSHEVAPFAGATRNLCDRKLVTLDDQTSALAKFWVFTSAHVAAHFTGVITDDFTSEFDPFSPQFGEKFSPANLPVALKDWSGTEISRVYSDQWGTYDGLTYSTWEVNPPNPTGYAPTMMVVCMNDRGDSGGALTGPDPLYNPAYSQFCYEIPFMPGQTQYMDTPVVPTSAFAGAGYNNPDCSYPDATPGISEVDGDPAPNTTNTHGPWVSTAGHTLRIFALGDQKVINNAYSGPSATAAPYNQKTSTRHYGFGAAKGTASIGNVTVPPGNITTWTDTEIILTVPTGVAACPVQQQSQYGGSAAQCGELVITSAPSATSPRGQQSVDTVNVTIGGKAPTHILPTSSIQAAIDGASPGDLLIVDPQTSATATAAAVPAIHQELLLMWKPVRLQGVAAASSVVNANTHPAGMVDVWRRQVNCLFGLALNGQAVSASNPYDPSGTYVCPAPATGNPAITASASANFSGRPTTLTFWSGVRSNPQVDRLPLEPVVGWDATQSGNLAELLQEPSLMGALEGAGITVLAKGMRFPPGSDPFQTTASAVEGGGFPAGTVLLTSSTSTSRNNTNGCGRGNSGANPFPSNFLCNPSSIDGLTITNASHGGGGIFVHGWGHNLQVANNRVTNNSGTLSGGINVGQGEFPPSYTVGGINADPGTCQSQNGLLPGTQLQYCFDRNVNVHHNAVTHNSSTGDELFSATPAGAGGVTICNGSDFYKFDFNWICGNLSTGDGGGLAHIGFSYNGDIEHNQFLFNQSTNPTIPTNGGGILVMGAPDVNPTCGATTDQDCLDPVPAATAVSNGVGPGLVINANLIRGNGAEAGSGGGIALQNVNGTEVLTFPSNPGQWYAVSVTNNIIDNNVAGWDGAGISLYDALRVNIVNNTIASNDSTASSGVLFDTIGNPTASVPGTNCLQTGSTTLSCPQPAGIVSIQNSAPLTANLPATVICPAGHGSGGTGNGGLTNGSCRKYSVPVLSNDILWHNRSFNISVGSLGTGTLNQQHVVALLPTLNQTSTGQCVTSSNYWDVGVRGDTGPANHSGGTLAPAYSLITDAADYPGANNISSDPAVVSPYCNGARTPPELHTMGYQVPPGIADATVPNPIFNLTPAATVDEGNNWVNISWGPLALATPTGTAIGNYALTGGSPAIDVGTEVGAPNTDFFGNTRPQGGEFDIGAVEFVKAVAADLDVAPQSLAFGSVARGRTSATQFVTLSSSGGAPLTVTGLVFTGAGFARATGFGLTQNCPTTATFTLQPGSTCRVYLTFTPATLGAVAGNLTINSNDATVDAAADRVVALSGTGTRLFVSPNAELFLTLNAGLSLPQTITVTNVGPAGGTGPISVAVTGNTNGVVFTTGSNCPAAGLAPNASCFITVRFRSPTAFTLGTATLTVSDTEPAAGTVALTGFRLF